MPIIWNDDDKLLTILSIYTQNFSCKKSKLESDIEELKSQLKQAWTVINDLAAKCDGLQKEVAQLKNNVAGNATRKQVMIGKEKVVNMERNVKELKTLNCTQVRVKTMQRS